MSDLLPTASLVVATLTVGIMAGFYYGWACSVMPGLNRTDDRTFVATMQATNRAILNAWFAACFAGALVFTAVAAGLHLPADRRTPLPWIVAALVLYAATLVSTMAVNVPLNNQIDAAGDPDRHPDLAAVRDRFEARWVRWHLFRTVVATAAFGCLAWALVLHGRLG